MIVRSLLIVLIVTSLARAQQPRTFTEAKTKRQIEATIEGVVLQVKRSDGKVVDVPLDRLTVEDQRWFIGWLESRVPPAPKPAPRTTGPITEEELGPYYRAELAKPEEDRRHPQLDFARLAVGHIGAIPYAFEPRHPTPFVVTRIGRASDDGDSIIEVEYYGLKVEGIQNLRPGMPVVQVPVLREVMHVALKGGASDQFADGDAVQIDGVYKVAGTRKIKVASGSEKTIYVLERIEVHSLKGKPKAFQVDGIE